MLAFAFYPLMKFLLHYGDGGSPAWDGVGWGLVAGLAALSLFTEHCYSCGLWAACSGCLGGVPGVGVLG